MVEWRTITEYPGYSVNNHGEVRNNQTNRVLKNQTLNNGYQTVTLCDANGHHPKSVHRLVAKEFVDNPRRCELINHIDGNKSNNNADNLEWCTQSENMKHAYRTGLQKPIRSQIEYSLARAAVKRKRPVRNIETGVCYPSIKECAEAEGVVHSAVSFHLAGRSRKRRFEYADEGGMNNG